MESKESRFLSQCQGGMDYNAVVILSAQKGRDKSAGRPRRRLEDNIELNLKDVEH
jgi:hypothetical protein